MSFEYKLTVRGYELDSYNHVNNAVYLNYFEQARWEILREEDVFDLFSKYFLVVTEVNIRFSREARLFDELIIKTDVEREDPYIIFKQKIFNVKTNLKLCEAKVKTLLIDQNRTPIGIPEELYQKIIENKQKV
jgi:acyl-CoA thioester hydrolase